MTNKQNNSIISVTIVVKKDIWKKTRNISLRHIPNNSLIDLKWAIKIQDLFEYKLDGDVWLKWYRSLCLPTSSVQKNNTDCQYRIVITYNFYDLTANNKNIIKETFLTFWITTVTKKLPIMENKFNKFSFNITDVKMYTFGSLIIMILIPFYPYYNNR